EAVQEVQEKCGMAPKLLVGARLVFVDGTPEILAYPSDRAAYGRLCRLLSLGKLRAAKGECILRFEDLFSWQEGLLFVLMSPHPHQRRALSRSRAPPIAGHRHLYPRAQDARRSRPPP